MAKAKFKATAPARSNRLLAALSEPDYLRLSPFLEPVSLAQDEVLYESRGPIDYAYFPTGAVASALTIMLDGTAIEVATIGREGLVGHLAATGSRISPNKLIIQIGDGGMRITADALQEAAGGIKAFEVLLSRYSAVYMAQVSQSVACNGLHRLEQRCCRWLLMSRDRVGSDDIRLTHEYLAIMLGVRRASVTDALKPLQLAGLLHSHWGKISILDGAGLEALSCECYHVVRDEHEKLFE